MFWIALIAGCILMAVSYIYTAAAYNVITDGIRFADDVHSSLATLEEKMHCKFHEFNHGHRIEKNVIIFCIKICMNKQLELCF